MQRLQRVAGGHRVGRDPVDQLLLDALVNGAEEILLALEVVVERAAGHARRAHDLLRAHTREPAVGEERAGRGDQRLARLLGAIGHPAARRRAVGSLGELGIVIDLLPFHTTCMLHTVCM